MSIKYIKNGIVNMLWDAEGFFESKTEGFVAAVHIYSGEKGDVPVMFKNYRAFILTDEDTDEPASREELFEVTRDCFIHGLEIEEECSDSYVELSDDASYDEDVLEFYGLSSEDGEDMLKRIKDLQEYWEIVEVDAFS